MNSNAAADEAPIGALLGRSAKKSWKPCQWRRDAAAVNERDNQLVIGALNIDGIRDWFTGQSAHSKQQ